MIQGIRFEKVVLAKKCLAVFKAESRKALGVETGGPLVGYLANNGVLIAVDACGPGPRAKLEPYSVTIDGEYAQKFCDRARRESDGVIDYIGDWHKHTGFSLRPSDLDIAAMKLMADFEWSPTRHPISLIYRKWPQGLRIYVWDGSGSLAQIPWTVSQA